MKIQTWFAASLAAAALVAAGCKSSNNSSANRASGVSENSQTGASESRQNVSGTDETDKTGHSTSGYDLNHAQAGNDTSQPGDTNAARENQSGSDKDVTAGAYHPQIAPSAGTDAEGGSTHYKVDKIDKDKQFVYLRHAEAESAKGSTSTQKEPQAGRDLVFTFDEFRTISPQAKGNAKIEDVLKEGKDVTVVKDKNGRVSKLIIEELQNKNEK